MILRRVIPRACIKETTAMLDLAFIATGAAFLFLCVLYSYACEHL